MGPVAATWQAAADNAQVFAGYQARGERIEQKR
jgi:hypothetical protein